jgi:hypothetical protein
MTYTFFKAEARQYSLGENIDFVRARCMARDLAEMVKETSKKKIDEAIGFGLYNKESDRLPNLVNEEMQVAYALFQGNLAVKTELLYVDERGDLMIAVQTVDEHDEHLSRPIGMFDLATFTRTKKTSRFEPEGELLFGIHHLHQIGVDPQFLYDFGDKYGRRL